MSNDSYSDRPWTQLYPPDIGATRVMDFSSIVDAWKARVQSNPDRAALRYFDSFMTAREVERASDALAVALASRGTQSGQRVAIYLQNIPQYVLIELAIWKLGAIVVPVNPMYRRQELRRLIDDADVVGIICADTSVPETLETLRDSSVRWVISTSSLDLQTRNDRRIFEGVERASSAPDGDVVALISEYDGAEPVALEISSEEIALLVYTSGTTGRPKGAENTHGNVLNVAVNFAEWTRLSPGDCRVRSRAVIPHHRRRYQRTRVAHYRHNPGIHGAIQRRCSSRGVCGTSGDVHH